MECDKLDLGRKEPWRTSYLLVILYSSKREKRVGVNAMNGGRQMAGFYVPIKMMQWRMEGETKPQRPSAGKIVLTSRTIELTGGGGLLISW